VILVGVGTNKKWHSRLVRRVTDSWASHAWLEIVEPDSAWVIHAQPEGVVRQHLGKVLRAYPTYRRYLLRCSPGDMRRAELSALSYVGRPYDWGVIRNALRLLWWKRTGSVIPPQRRPWQLHCTEFVCLVLRELDIPDTSVLDPEATTPGKLAEWLTDHPDFKEVQ